MLVKNLGLKGRNEFREFSSEKVLKKYTVFSNLIYYSGNE